MKLTKEEQDIIRKAMIRLRYTGDTFSCHALRRAQFPHSSIIRVTPLVKKYAEFYGELAGKSWSGLNSTLVMSSGYVLGDSSTDYALNTRLFMLELFLVANS